MKTENDKHDRRTDLRTLDEHGTRHEVYNALAAVEGQTHGQTRDARETPHAPCDDEEDRDDREDTRDERDDERRETRLLVTDGGRDEDGLVLELRDTATGASLCWTLESFTDLTNDGDIYYVFLDEDGDGRVMVTPEEFNELGNRVEEAVIYD